MLAGGLSPIARIKCLNVTTPTLVTTFILSGGPSLLTFHILQVTPRTISEENGSAAACDMPSIVPVLICYPIAYMHLQLLEKTSCGHLMAGAQMRTLRIWHSTCFLVTHGCNYKHSFPVPSINLFCSSAR